MPDSDPCLKSQSEVERVMGIDNSFGKGIGRTLVRPKGGRHGWRPSTHVTKRWPYTSEVRSKWSG